ADRPRRMSRRRGWSGRSFHRGSSAASTSTSSAPSTPCFMSRPPPPRSSLFPYTTLFRSAEHRRTDARADRGQRFGFPSDHGGIRSEEHTSELQSRGHLVCRLLLEKKKSGRASNCESCWQYSSLSSTTRMRRPKAPSSNAE